MMAHIFSQLVKSSAVRPDGNPGTPTDWLSACRTVAPLAVGTELRPQLGDPRVVIEDATLGEHVHHGRGHPYQSSS